MSPRLLLLLLSVGCVRVDDSDFAARVDVDGDGDRAVAYGGGDCDDTDPAVSSDAVERCNGVDDNCDGVVDNTADAVTVWKDDDGDGFGDPEAALLACEAMPDGYVDNDTDCDDTDAAVRPGAPEDCNGIDDDCDPETPEPEPVDWFVDEDGDGFGTDASVVTACLQPGDDYVLDGGDCDDATGGASPGNDAEVCNDGLDNDCDGTHDGCGWSGTHSLSDVGRMLYGTNARAGVGAAVVAAAGLTEAESTVVIGAPGDSGPGGAAGDGAVYLVAFPISAGAPQRLVDRADFVLGGVDGTAEGGEADPAAGAALAVGDADGDGITDLLIGAPGSGAGPGAAWLVTGPVTGDMSLTVDAAALWLTGVTTPGGGTAGEAGRAVAMGDVQGLGSAQLLIAAPGLGTASSPAEGAVFIVPGDAVGTGRLAEHPRIEGRAPGGVLGARSVVLDWDGDGVDDLVLGAPGLTIGSSAGAGEVAVVLGPVEGDLTTADADARLETGAASDLFGGGLAAVGDVTGDGGADVVVAAPGRFSLTGAAWVLDAVPGGDGKVWDASFGRLDGTASGDLFGTGIASAGDVDRDGEGDLLIAIPGEGHAGRTFLVHGPLPRGNILPASVGTTFSGVQDGDLVGLAMGGGPDLDLDATGDMFFGLPGLSPAGGATAGGAVVVVHGDGF